MKLQPIPSGDPSPTELDAIESEWPLIAAELDLLDAEILILSAVDGPSPLDWRRLRRAEQRVMRAAASIGTPAAPTQLAA